MLLCCKVLHWECVSSSATAANAVRRYYLTVDALPD